MPKTEQKLIIVILDVEINRDIYEIVQKEIEVSIVQASSLGGVQIIDNAYCKKSIQTFAVISLLASIWLDKELFFIFYKIEFFSRVNLSLRHIQIFRYESI